MSRTSTNVADVRIITHDAAFGMGLVVSLRSTPYSITIVDPGISALPEVAGHGNPPVAAVVELTGAETVVELRNLLRSWHPTRCLFVIRHMPLSAPLARIIKEHGGVILSKDEPAIVITATLITMMLDANVQEA